MGTATPEGLAVYLVYEDVARIADWLMAVLGFEDKGRAVRDGIVTNAELGAGSTSLLLERGTHPVSAYPRGSRWTGVWVDDPDSWYHRMQANGVDASPPEDEPWGVRLVRVPDPEGHIWALIKRTS